VEQRYQAVLAAIRDGVPIVEAARRFAPISPPSGVYADGRRRADREGAEWLFEGEEPGASSDRTYRRATGSP
jgi:hypothetical protein